MTYVISLAIGAAIAGYLALAYRRRLFPFKPKVIGVIRDNRQQAIIDRLKVKTEICEAPGFPQVWSAGVLSQDVQDGIEDAFKERQAAARAKGWVSKLNAVEYTMYVFPSVRDTDLDGNYSPAFQVFLPPGSPYIGSEYDKGGWIYAAEQCLTDGNNNLTNQFVIAANNSRAYTARVTSYGLDHLFLWHNDRAEYERTKDHSQGGGHPLW